MKNIFFRIVICFIETSSKNGKYHTNPFNLLRSWKVKKATIQIDQALSQRERLLEERIKQLESRISSFQTVFDPTIRGKGRGKKSKSHTAEPNFPSTSTRQKSQSQKPASVASEIWTDDLDDEEETFYLKNVELTLNGTLIDQIDDSQSEDECMASYFRLYYNNGQMNSLYSCGISYDDFRYTKSFICIEGP